MNRTSRDSFIGSGRNIPAVLHRRGHRVTGVPNLMDPMDDKLDLFSKGRRSFSVIPTDESDVSLKLGRLSIGSVKLEKNGSDDFLSPDGGKHDYDWLLTPPATPFSNGNETQTSLLAPRRGGAMARSTSTTKASRLSTSHSENNHTVKPSRSNSATRTSISSTHKSAAMLNTSSASVSSCIRPATPTSRSSSRNSVSSPRPLVSRSSTPSKPRPVANAPPLVDKPRSSVSSRPSTPASRSQSSTNSNGTPARVPSRPSTPTHPSTPIRHNAASSSSGHSNSTGRCLSNGRTISCPSSPAMRVRPPPQPITLPDFSLETPPNLLTTLPDRPLSAGRSRPTITKRQEDLPNVSLPKRQPSLVATRGRMADPTLKNRTVANGFDSRRESTTRRTVKSSTDSTSFIKNMEIRNGSNGTRRVSSTNLFPQSIRPGSEKNHSWTSPVSSGTSTITSNDSNAEKGTATLRYSENGSEVASSAKLISRDIYESCRYDTILLKEDLKNTNWLHSIDDMPEQELIFDNGFGNLPEPFSPL